MVKAINRNSAPPSEDPAINQTFLYIQIPHLYSCHWSSWGCAAIVGESQLFQWRRPTRWHLKMVRIPQQDFIPHEKKDKSTKKITRLKLVTEDHLGVLASKKAWKSAMIIQKQSPKNSFPHYSTKLHRKCI